MHRQSAKFGRAHVALFRVPAESRDVGHAGSKRYVSFHPCLANAMSTDQEKWHVVVEETTERRQYATFEKLPDLRNLQNQILAKDLFVVRDKPLEDDWYKYQRWTVMVRFSSFLWTLDDPSS